MLRFWRTASDARSARVGRTGQCHKLVTATYGNPVGFLTAPENVWGMCFHTGIVSRAHNPGVNMKRSRDSMIEAIQQVLADGPQRQEVVVAELGRRGWRHVTVAELFLICQERHIAEFDEETSEWVPVGSSSKLREPAGRVRIGKPLTPGGVAEVARLRAHAGLRTPPKPRQAFPVAPSWREVAGQVVGALTDEHSEAVRQLTDLQVHLDSGTRYAATEGRDLIVFQMQDDVQIRENSPATLVIRDHGEPRTFAVDVISRFGTELTLSVPGNMPSAPRATLRIDLTWLICKQRDRFSELLRDPSCFNTVAALAVSTPRRTREPRALTTVTPDRNLNEEQNYAVQSGATPGLTWLWGPPGTGKTTTLSVLIAHLFASGKRILLSAPTNTAVDVALVGVLRKLPPHVVGDVVRIGQPVDVTLVNRSTPILTEEIAADRGKEIAQRLVALQAEQAICEATLEKLTKSGTSPTGRLAQQRRIAEIKELANQLHVALGDIRRQIVRDAQFVAATAHQATLDLLAEDHFDVVIVDEASMLPAALAMLVAGLGSGHTVIAGDFRQLGPVALSDTHESHKWLHDSPFEASQVVSEVLRGSAPADLVALNTQHRMRPQICDVITSGFYRESPLRAATSVNSRERPPLPFTSSETVAVDTSELLTWLGRRGGVRSRFNLMHAQISASIAGSGNSVETAYISPFNSQASLLRSFTADFKEYEASTVHKFQGGEADRVVFDCVDAAGSNFHLHPWFRDGGAGGDGARLINVAASRAREQLVVIADFGRIHRARRADDACSRFIRQLLDTAEHVGWRDLVDESSSPTTVETSLSRLAADIDAADGPVEIRSSTLDPRSLSSVLEAMRVTAKRVPVALWFRPDRGGELPSALAPLIRSQVLLRPADPLHESMAIAGSVVWSSSSPLLGGEPSSWLRTEHAGLADATRMIVRRRSTGQVQGSDRAAERCACSRPLVYLVQNQRAQMVCQVCDAKDARRARRR